ncbi:anti-repressor SinI family protein [Thalassobacillus sp. C254]|nr:anti-repressor SinI family protein [Thalassobacillus sp. C254]
MNSKANTKIDKEWVFLIQEALSQGLTPEEIRAFFRRKSCNNKLH